MRMLLLFLYNSREKIYVFFFELGGPIVHDKEGLPVQQSDAHLPPLGDGRETIRPDVPDGCGRQGFRQRRQGRHRRFA